MSVDSTTDSPNNDFDTSIAVIGMACRFPGAPDLEAFRDLLINGREGIRFYSAEELAAFGVSENLIKDSRFVPASGELPGADEFDAEFFGVSPREAAFMDPQHRLFLECCHRALEDGALDPAVRGSSIGVYASCGLNTYLHNVLAGSLDLMTIDGVERLAGNDKDFLATRVSYKLNLCGPSVVVQAGCSSSLLAVHVASQALLSGECNAALAGGVSLSFPTSRGYLYVAEAMFSADGHCRAYDADAHGCSFGDGVGVVLLKRLKDALSDGDRIYAVIKGSAANNDGSSKIGFTAPSISGQVAVIQVAQQLAGFSPDSVGFIEGHGTATELGDPIEVEALREVFGHSRATPLCFLGSVKSNIGHLGVASGIAGFIKSVVTIHEGHIPPTLHFRKFSERVSPNTLPLTVNSDLRSWPEQLSPRRAGVSSFGVGGTNVHVCLEEPGTPVLKSLANQSQHLFLLSGKTESDLKFFSAQISGSLNHSTDLGAIARTLRERTVYPIRSTAIASSVDELRLKLQAISIGKNTSTFSRLDLVLPVQDESFCICIETLRKQIPVLQHNYSKIEGILEELVTDQSSANLLRKRTFLATYAFVRMLLAMGLRVNRMYSRSIHLVDLLEGIITIDDAIKLILTEALPEGIQPCTLMAGASDIRLLLLGAHDGEGKDPDQQINLFRDCDNPWEQFLEALSQLWLCSVAFDWHSFNTIDPASKVSLPGHPFHPTRFYAERSDNSGSSESRSIENTPKVWVESWHRTERSTVAWRSTAATPRCVAVCGDRGGFGERFALWLNSCGITVIRITSFSSESFSMSPNNPVTVVFDFRALDQGDKKESALARERLNGLRELVLYCEQSVMLPQSIVCVSKGVFSVLGDEVLSPANATLLGALSSVPQEFPGMTTALVDFASDWELASESFLFNALLSEVSPLKSSMRVAYRARSRWELQFDKLEIPSNSGISLGGTYIITGGLGTLGWFLALYLVRTYRAHVYLLSRRDFPQRELWEQQISSPSSSATLQARIAEALEAERAGGTFSFVKGDVSDAQSLTLLCQRIRDSRAGIDAILHLAGASHADSYTTLAQTSAHDIDCHFRPKVDGVDAIARAVNEVGVRSVILFSSISAHLGGAKLFVYAAANAFLGAFARQQTSIGSARWLCIEWDRWERGAEPQIAKTLAKHALSDAEGLSLFDSVAEMTDIVQVLATRRDLSVENQTCTTGEAIIEQFQQVPFDQSSSPETWLCITMQRILNVSEMGPEDNFFECGGDSLLALQLIDEIERGSGRRISIAAVFDAPTPLLLSNYFTPERHI